MPENPLTSVSIIDVRDPSWQDDLFNVLEYYPIPGLATAPFERVLDVALEELHANIIVVEEYIGTDYSDEYAALYSRSFQDRGKRCHRLHFFAHRGCDTQARRLKPEDLLFLPEDMRAAYVGYCVMRPLRTFRVSDTILKSPHRQGGADLVHCQAEFEANLLGNKLPIRGMPFLQQDAHVTICAGASLWSVGRYMHRIGEIRRHRPSEVTELAMCHITMGSTRQGLIDPQINDALRLMNLCPHPISPRNKEDAMEVLYAAVESELPVIVGVRDPAREPGHALTVIGHTFPDPLSLDPQCDSLAQAVDSFIVHDDAAGPYLKLAVGVFDELSRTCLTLNRRLPQNAAGQGVGKGVFVTSGVVRS